MKFMLFALMEDQEMLKIIYRLIQKGMFLQII